MNTDFTFTHDLNHPIINFNNTRQGYAVQVSPNRRVTPFINLYSAINISDKIQSVMLSMPLLCTHTLGGLFSFEKGLVSMSLVYTTICDIIQTNKTRQGSVHLHFLKTAGYSFWRAFYAHPF